MKDIMLDLETMGTSSDAAIIAVGACWFDVEKKTIGSTFFEVVDLQSSVDAGLKMDASTVMWWMRQSDEARGAFDRKGHTLNYVLQKFQQWIGDSAEVVKIWGNGASFDNAILSNAYSKAGLIHPWNFWNDRCYRTKKADRPDVKMIRSGTHHNALDDAMSQAEHLIDIYNT